MKVIICGAGQVGYGIAERLAAEHNDVSVIDVSPDLIRNVRDTLDAKGFVGHGAHPDVLARAGAQDADMLVAVTLYDEVNMIACQVAHSIFNIPTKVARIRAQAYLSGEYQDLFSRDHSPIDVVISPEREVGELILRRIAVPGANDVVAFADDKITLLAIECLDECPVISTPLAQLSDLFPDLLSTVVAVSRQGALFVPRSADQLMTGDLAYVICSKDHVRRTLSLFGHDKQEATRILIAGGGNIGLYVARILEKTQSKVRVKIIEHERERALSVADQLRRTVVLHGSALDQKLLHEADVDDTDLMVALTNDDQVNILSSVIAKQLGCRSNLALINDPAYQDFTRTLSLDAQINPRTVTISRVLQQVRRGRVRAVHSIGRGAAEVIEAEALETSPLVGTTLRAFDLPPGIRIGAVLRDGRVVKPSGDFVIQAKDRVVMFVMAESVKTVEQMFRVSLEFF